MKSLAILTLLQWRSQIRRPSLYLLLVPPMATFWAVSLGNGTPEAPVDGALAASLTMAIVLYGWLWLPVDLALAKRAGVLARFRATPVTRGQYLAADALARALILFIALTVLVLGSRLLVAGLGPDRLPWAQPGFPSGSGAGAAAAFWGGSSAASPFNWLWLAILCLGALACLAWGYAFSSFLIRSGPRVALGFGAGLVVLSLLPTGILIPGPLLPRAVQLLVPYDPLYYLYSWLQKPPAASAGAMASGWLLLALIGAGFLAHKFFPWE